MKTFKEFKEESAVAVNSAGAGNVPGIGIGPDGEPPVAKSTIVRRKKKDEDKS